MTSQRCQSSVRWFWGVLFLSSLTMSLWLGHTYPVVGQMRLKQIAIAQSPAPSQLVEQGIAYYQTGDFQSAISTWQTALRANQERHSLSEDEVNILKYLARAYQQVGQVDQAITHLEQVITYYRQIKDQKQLGRMLTEQAQLYSDLGQQRQAIALLCSQEPVNLTCSKDSALEIARSQSDPLGEVAALGSLGNAYRLQGEYDKAEQYLLKSLEIARKIDNRIYISSALNGLANTYTSIAKRDRLRSQVADQSGDQKAAQKFKQEAVSYDNKAMQYFENNLNFAHVQNDQQSEVQILLNLSLLYHRNRPADSLTLVNNALHHALAILEHLPDSRNKAYAAIKLADILQLVALDLADSEINPAIQCFALEPSTKSVELLNTAVSIARHINDREAEAFAIGSLGHNYECRKDYEQALNLTQQAQLTTVAKESLYLWEWQAGRIFKAQNRVPDAINAYRQSVNTLKSIHRDIAIAGRDFRFDFQDTVEPVYRQLVELMLERVSHLSSESEIQDYFASALNTVDALRLAELRNYLGNDCNLEVIEKPVTLMDKKTAVLSSIILKDRIAIILTLPGNQRMFRSQIHWVTVKSKEATEIVNDLRLKLEKRSDRENTFRAKSQQVYDWFIRPFVSDLEREKIETIVFINDGILRSIPMAALYNGKQFLIEKYAIANTPSLTLTAPTPLNKRKLKVLAFGLTKSAVVDTDNGQTFFEPLSYVLSELNRIKTIMPGSIEFFNKDFTINHLKQELDKNTYPILHLATHAQFGINSRETFLVTGNLVIESSPKTTTIKFDNEKLTMNELYQIVKNTRRRDSPIELLTLSACETAAGSNRDALGIAGISLQAGSQSAMASLWQVDDEATAQLVSKFYQGLRGGLSRAQALQVTQKAWLEEHPQGLYSHPGYWAPFILIGNWI